MIDDDVPEPVDAREALMLDEQYSGVLAAMSFAGGRATLHQLERFLGGTIERQAFLQSVHRRGYGYFDHPRERFPVRSQGYVLAVEVIGEFSGGDRLVSMACSGPEIIASVHRFEHRLQTGRNIYGLRDCIVDWIVRPGADKDALRAAHMALLPFRCIFVDLHPDGPRIVTVDAITWVEDFWGKLEALGPIADALGRPLDWRILCGSKMQAGRMRAILDVVADHIPPGVVPTVVEQDVARYFVEGRRLGEFDRDVFGSLAR